MFIEIEELKTVAYTYQLEEITESDDDILIEAIRAATEELKSYLSVNHDTDLILSETGNARNPLLVAYCKSIALWYIIQLSNVDMIYQQEKERYDRAIKWLDNVAKGKLSPDLPLKTNVDTGLAEIRLRFGSAPKKSWGY